MRIALIALFLTFVQVASAQIAHDLTLYSEDGIKFKLKINGKVINDQFASNVEMENIEHDYFTAVIEFEDSEKYPQMKKMVQLASPGEDKDKPQSNVYVIKIKKGATKLRFQSRSAKKIQDPDINIIINN